MQKKVCHFFNKPTGCKAGDKCPFSHTPGAGEAIQQVEGEKKVCPFINNPSGCKFGAKCKNYHPEVAAAPTTAPTAAPTSAPVVAVAKKEIEVCYFYNTPKGCQYGDKCTKVHIKMAPTSAPAPKKYTCFEFVKNKDKQGVGLYAVVRYMEYVLKKAPHDEDAQIVKHYMALMTKECANVIEKGKAEMGN